MIRNRRPASRERWARAAEYLTRRLFRPMRAGVGDRTMTAAIWFGGLVIGHDRAAAEERALIEGTGGGQPLGIIRAPRSRR